MRKPKPPTDTEVDWVMKESWKRTKDGLSVNVTWNEIIQRFMVSCGSDISCHTWIDFFFAHVPETTQRENSFGTLPKNISTEDFRLSSYLCLINALFFADEYNLATGKEPICPENYQICHYITERAGDAYYNIRDCRVPDWLTPSLQNFVAEKELNHI